jgi:hypothetical protein
MSSINTFNFGSNFSLSSLSRQARAETFSLDDVLNAFENDVFELGFLLETRVKNRFLDMGVHFEFRFDLLEKLFMCTAFGVGFHF